jgi:hypothetical protein
MGERLKQMQEWVYQTAGMGDGTKVIVWDRTATTTLKGAKLVTTNDFIRCNLGNPRYNASIC